MAIDRPNEPERPVDTENVEMGWGSDVVAELVRRLDIPYIAVVPGARCQLSRVSGQSRQLSWQSRSADVGLPARRTLRRHCPRL
jgi:hypothetical protein